MTVQANDNDLGAAPHAAPETEADLLAAARRGDARAVRALVQRYNPRLFRTARGIVDSDAEAEEVVQETYLAAFTRLDQYRGDAAFATWITRIAINAARMRLRRSRLQESYDTVTEDRSDNLTVLPFPGAAASRPETLAGRAQMRTVLERSIARLPADLRLPFLLFEVESLSIRRIAADLDLNPLTVKTRLFRARRRLRAALEEELRGGFDAIFPFDGARCAGMADRVVKALQRAGRV